LPKKTGNIAIFSQNNLIFAQKIVTLFSRKFPFLPQIGQNSRKNGDHNAYRRLYKNGYAFVSKTSRRDVAKTSRKVDAITSASGRQQLSFKIGDSCFPLSV
jgi:hypothetical protein